MQIFPTARLYTSQRRDDRRALAVEQLRHLLLLVLGKHGQVGQFSSEGKLQDSSQLV
jgi:hypothetical protein